MELSIEEKNLYFSGLPSCPRLVARSNFHVIFKPSNGGGRFWPVKKYLSPASPNHKIVALWDGGPLRKDIINALDGINWTAIDILRLGFHRDPDRLEQPEPEHPHVLLVSVTNTTWPQGFPAVMSCRRIMEWYGLDDIHCEMKESVVERSASTPHGAPLLAPKLTSQSEFLPEPEEQPIFHNRTMASERLGASIASLDDPTREGAKGLYLRRKDTGATLALTCRHVIFQGSELSNEPYQYNSDATPRLVIQPGSSTLDELLTSATGYCKVVEKNLSTLEARANYPYTEESRHTLLTDSQNRLSSGTQWRDYLQSIATPESRIIGHVLFSPKVSPGIKSPSGERRLRDWALIELHPNKHQTALPDLKNAVTLTRAHAMKIYMVAENEILDFEGPTLLPMDGLLQLEGIMPEAEIKMPTTMDSHNKEPRLVVAMYGNISKVKTGFSNCITSILREVMNGKVEYSEEWGIIGRKANSSTGSKPFAVPGDSGSCIWDMDGRVAGIVVGGLDVTYAHPIEWLLEDIRTQSGIDVELV